MTRVVAHRGGPGLGTRENTLAAFARAADLGVAMAELDVRRTLDGALAVFHDEAAGGSPVADLTLAALRGRCDFHVPTLDEVLRACRGRIALDVEIKESGYEAEILEQVTRIGEPETVVLKSFDLAACRAIRALRPDLPLGYLIDVDCPRVPVETLAELGASFVGPAATIVDAAFVRTAHAAGVEVWVWTVQEEAEMRRLIALGADVLITDYPDRALAVLSEL